MKKKINVKLLRQVQQAIISEPKLYDQGTWAEHVNKEGYRLNSYDDGYKDADVCGTRCCIAGWAVQLSVPKTAWKKYVNEELDIQYKATKLIGVSGKGWELFDSATDPESSWPEKYAKAYLNAKTPAGRARAGYNMIEDFIKQNA